MLAAALEAEVDAYVCAPDRRTSTTRATDWWCATATPSPGRSLTGAGPIEVRAPRVNDRRVDEATGERMRFRRSILPPWARKSPKVAEVLPLMYLHGMSSGDFVARARGVLRLGRRAVGLGDHPADRPTGRRNATSSPTGR